MNRRDFLKISGLGASGLFLTTALSGTPITRRWKAEETIDRVVNWALQNGAIYVDARIGKCEIQGHGGKFEPVSLMDSELLGVRICTREGWRFMVLRDYEMGVVESQLTQAFKAKTPKRRQGDWWVSADFCRDELLASKSSQPEMLPDLNQAWMRYAELNPLPKGSQNLLFCDILIEQ